MNKEDLITIFNRELTKLITEITAYTTEANLWKVDKEITNSAGNLCLHLIGNLNTFIGKDMGQTGYVRDRSFEFAGKNVPRETMIIQLRETITMIDTVLSSLTKEALEKPFPQQLFGYEMTYGYFLIHLVTHLGYHLGQINYHRRLLDH